MLLDGIPTNGPSLSVDVVNGGLQFTPDFTSLGSTNVQVEYWNGDVLVGTGEPGVSAGWVYDCIDGFECEELWEKHILEMEIWDPFWDTSGDGSWLNPGPPPLPFLFRYTHCSPMCMAEGPADSIVFRTTVPQSWINSSLTVTHLDLTSNSMEALHITSINSGYMDAAIRTAPAWSGSILGVPASGTVGSSLTVVGGDDNEEDDVIGGNEDGVVSYVDPSTKLDMSWRNDWVPSILTQNPSLHLWIGDSSNVVGATEMWGFERILPASDPWSESGSPSAGMEVETTFDFSGVGSSSYSMELYDGGSLVSSFAGVPNGSGPWMSRAAASTEVTYRVTTGSDQEGVLLLAETVVVEVNGSLISTDEIHVRPEAPTQDLSAITNFGFELHDVPELSITEITSTPEAWIKVGHALPGVSGDPLLVGTGSLAPGSKNRIDLSNAAPTASAFLFYGLASSPLAAWGGTLLPGPSLSWMGPYPTSLSGELSINLNVPATGWPSGMELWAQWVILDAAAIQNVSMSNAVRGLTP